MSIYHVKTVIIADDPVMSASGGVVPSHWNEAHAIVVDGTTIHTHSNKIDLDAYSPSSFLASNAGSNFAPTAHAHTQYLTTAALSNHGHDEYLVTSALSVLVGTGALTDLQYLSNTSAITSNAFPTVNSSNLVAVSRSTEWATSALSGTSNNLAAATHTHSQYQTAGDYLTTAAQSVHTHSQYGGTGFTGTNASATINSNGIQLSVAAGGGGGNTLTLSGSNGSLQTNGVSIVGSNGVSAYTTGGNSFVIAMPNQTDLTNHAHSYSNATTAVSSRVVQIAASNTTFSGNVTITGSNGINIGSGAGGQIIVSLIDSHHVDALAFAGNNAGTAFSQMTSGTVTYNFAGAISGSQNGNAITVSAPAQTVQTQNSVLINGNSGAFTLAGTTTAATGAGLTVNSNGVNVSVVTNYSTGYSAKAESTHSHGNPTLFLTNINGTTASASNGLSFSLSAAGGGVTNQTGPNIAAGGSTVTSGDVVFSNSNGVSFGFNGSTITASVNAGGGGVTYGGWELFDANGASSASSLAQKVMYMQKMLPEANYSFNNFELKMSNSMVTTGAASAAVSYTIHYGLYSLDTNNSYQQISTSSMFMAGSNSSNNSMGITVSQGANSFTSNASTATIAPLMSGFKHFYLPFTSTLTAGGNYAFAIMASSTTTGGTGALRLAIVHHTIMNNITVGKIYGSTISASNATFVGDYAMGAFSATVNALTSAVAKSQMTNTPNQARLQLQLEV